MGINWLHALYTVLIWIAVPVIVVLWLLFDLWRKGGFKK